MWKPQDQRDTKLNEKCELNVDFDHDQFYYIYKENEMFSVYESDANRNKDKHYLLYHIFSSLCI